MKRFWQMLLIVMLFLAAPLPVAADRIAFGYVTKIHPVAYTDIYQNGRRLSLCMSGQAFTAFYGASFGFSPERYWLMDGGCGNRRRMALTVSMQSKLVAQGLIPEGQPSISSLPIGAIANSFWGWGIIVFFASLGYLRALRARVRKKFMSVGSGPAFQMLDAMCHVALADGTVDARELVMLKQICRQTTPKRFSNRQIADCIEMASSDKAGGNFSRYSENLTTMQQKLLLRAVVMVAMADESVGDAEANFISGVAGSLSIGAEAVAAIFEEFRPASDFA